MIFEEPNGPEAVAHRVAVALFFRRAWLSDRAESADAQTIKVPSPAVAISADMDDTTLLLNSGLFSDGYYRSQAADVRQAPLDHYLNVGQYLGLSPHPLIQPAYLMSQLGRGASEFRIRDYIFKTDMRDMSPHPLFDAGFYLALNPSIAASAMNPLLHFLHYGYLENLAPNRLFDNFWYLAANPDVQLAGLNPLVHYAEFGVFEHRVPHPLFDDHYYLRCNTDVANSTWRAFEHFVSLGLGEGRLPSKRAELIGLSHCTEAADLLAVAMIALGVSISATGGLANVNGLMNYANNNPRSSLAPPIALLQEFFGSEAPAFEVFIQLAGESADVVGDRYDDAITWLLATPTIT